MTPTLSVSPSKCSFLLAIAITLAGCGGGATSSPNPPTSDVTIALNQSSADISVGTTKQFTATVQGTTNTAVAWSVDGIAGGNSITGTINASGLYTAPSAPGAHKIIATSMAQTTKTASATVTVLGDASISPATAAVVVGMTQQFSASIPGSTNGTFTWAVDGAAGGNAAVGTVTSAGLYTAPAQAGNHKVTATSTLDASLAASAPVSVFTFQVLPAAPVVATATTQQFSASIQGLSNANVTWSVDGVAGGNATIGLISAGGLYTAPSSAGNHTVTATSVENVSAKANTSLTVFVFSVSPAVAVLPAGGNQQFTATIQGLNNNSVTWSVDGIAGGNSTVGTITTAGFYVSPFATGGHTVTAQSVAEPSSSISSPVTLTNTSVGSVLTYHNDDARDGANTQETTLTPGNVNSSQFGKLYSFPVDGQIYTQPLYLPKLNINGTTHDVVFVVTENNSVYAFDADGLQTTPLWMKTLGQSIHTQDIYGIYPLMGITSTPLLDVTTGTLYVLTKTLGGFFTLHAMDITSGGEKFGGPVNVTGSVPGTGWDSVNGTLTLEPACYQRMALVLNPVTNTINVPFGHCNHGWILAYDKTSLQLKAIYNDTPNGAGGGLWGGDGATAIDDRTGNLYLISGTDPDDPGSGYNDAFLRLLPEDLSMVDFFQPDNENFLRTNDADLGSGAAIVMPDNSSSTPHETIGGGKDGRIFVINRDEMGSFSPTNNNVIQVVQTGVKEFDNIFSTPAYWNGFIYYHCEDDVLKAYSWKSGLLSDQPVSQGSIVYGAHGATSSVSSDGISNAIVWEIDNSNYNTSNDGAAILRAYDATNVSQELYDTTQAGTRDTPGLALKFTVPTIIAGKVFMPTSTELDVYGLLNP